VVNKTKKYAYKAKYLKASVEEAEEIVSIAKLELDGEIRKIQAELNVHDPVLDNDFGRANEGKSSTNTLDQDPNSAKASSDDPALIDKEQESEKPSIVVPDWAKKIYRKITLKTHPDRLINCSPDEKIKKTKVYTRVTEAYASGDYSILVMEALDMGLSLPEEKDVYDILNNKCKGLEKKLTDIKDSLYWMWYHGDDKLKKEILNKFVNSRGWTRPGAAKKKSRNKKHPGKSIVWARKKLDTETEE